MNGNKTVRKYEQAHSSTIPAGLRSLVNQNAELLKIVQDSMFMALQETLEVGRENHRPMALVRTAPSIP